MRELDLLRKVFAREARRAVGRNPQYPTGMQANAQHAFSETAFIALPEDLDGFEQIQDPVTGEFFFTAGFDVVGSAPIAPGS